MTELRDQVLAVLYPKTSTRMDRQDMQALADEIMPVIAVALAEQRDGIERAMVAIELQATDERHAEGLVKAFNRCLTVVRDFGKDGAS